MISLHFSNPTSFIATILFMINIEIVINQRKNNFFFSNKKKLLSDMNQAF